MLETHNSRSNKEYDEIDLREIFNALLQGKWIIISITAFLSIIGVIYSLSLPNIYESKVLLSPESPSNKMSRSFRNYSISAISTITY